MLRVFHFCKELKVPLCSISHFFKMQHLHTFHSAPVLYCTLVGCSFILIFYCYLQLLLSSAMYDHSSQQSFCSCGVWNKCRPIKKINYIAMQLSNLLTLVTSHSPFRQGPVVTSLKPNDNDIIKHHSDLLINKTQSSSSSLRLKDGHLVHIFLFFFRCWQSVCIVLNNLCPKIMTPWVFKSLRKASDYLIPSILNTNLTIKRQHFLKYLFSKVVSCHLRRCTPVFYEVCKSAWVSRGLPPLYFLSIFSNYKHPLSPLQ